MSKKTKPKTVRRRWKPKVLPGQAEILIVEKSIAPIREWVGSRRGNATLLKEEMTKACGRTIHRQMIEGWLAKEAHAFHEPRLGIGLMLITVAGKLMEQEICSKAPTVPLETIA